MRDAGERGVRGAGRSDHRRTRIQPLAEAGQHLHDADEQAAAAGGDRRQGELPGADNVEDGRALRRAAAGDGEEPGTIGRSAAAGALRDLLRLRRKALSRESVAQSG